MRRHSISTSLLATFVALLLANVQGFATNWSGNISTHVTWVADSDITIVNGLTVTSTGSLTIEEGVAITGSGSPSLTVQSGGQLEIGSAGGSPVTIDGVVSITLDNCEGTTPITNTDFSNCGDPNGDDPFITLLGGEDDGYVITNCNFDKISSSSIHFGEGAKGEVGTCGWFPWAGSPVIIGPTASNTLSVKIIGNTFDGTTCGWFPWAGEPVIDNRLGGGAACGVIIKENEFIGMSNVGVGVRVSEAPHDNGLATGQFDFVMEHNLFNDLEVGLEIVDGAEEYSTLIRNNIFHNNITGISVTSTNANPVLAVIANNTLFDNTTAANISLNGNAIPDGLKIANTVA